MATDRCCGNCRSFSLLNPDDPTAGEGRCNRPERPLGVWPMGYWPAQLRQDRCSDHRFANKGSSNAK
jgi:hypothetical protein